MTTVNRAGGRSVSAVESGGLPVMAHCRRPEPALYLADDPEGLRPRSRHSGAQLRNQIGQLRRSGRGGSRVLLGEHRGEEPMASVICLRRPPQGRAILPEKRCSRGRDQRSRGKDQRSRAKDQRSRGRDQRSFGKDQRIWPKIADPGAGTSDPSGGISEFAAKSLVPGQGPVIPRQGSTNLAQKC